jgi:hypothetical protein
MGQQTPSLGQTVLVTVHPTTNNGTDTAPAVITRVWSEVLVNVAVQLDGHNGTQAKTSVALYPDRDALDAAKAKRDAEVPTGAEYVFTAAYWPPES